jgi:transglutaminase-like putative cysteine protease
MMKLFARRKKGQGLHNRDHYRIPRFAFVWLLAAVVSVILPHVLRLPLWLTAMCLLCIVGRILVFQGRMSYPCSKLKSVLVLVMMLLVVFQYGRDAFATDSMVGVLLVGITLKLLEMHRKRDVLMVLYLCYFTVIAEFIYSQSIPIAVYMCISVLVISSAMISLNQTGEHQSVGRTVKLAAIILLQSAPLMMAFFLLFPRISPLWSVPVQSNSATTGLSDTMSPGDIGNLAQSGEVAFRVKFDGEMPPFNELYWRGLTLDNFDGREWRRIDRALPQRLSPDRAEELPWFRDIEYSGRRYAYNIILEPTFQNWIFTLQMPSILDDRMRMRRDFQIESYRRITQRYSYDAISFLDFRADTDEERILRRSYTFVPADSNPRATVFGQELRTRFDSTDAIVNAVLQKFREEEFYYTLTPELLGDAPVDEFLFETREGFCEHFASSFTYLMRAAGIPSRVVTGYQGGEVNPYDDTLTVRQYDAHAWSEVWMEGRGWIRVDPTAAVAPNRINQGSNTVLQEADSFLGDEVFSLMRFRNSLLLNDLRLRLEMIDYAWNRFVLNYDQESQFRFFSNLFGQVTRLKIMLVLLGFLGLMVAFVAFTVFRQPAYPKATPATRLYRKFCDHMASQGFPRKTGETPRNYLERMLIENPQWAGQLQEITDAYTELAFINPEAGPERLKRLELKIRKFRLIN